MTPIEGVLILDYTIEEKTYTNENEIICDYSDPLLTSAN